MAFPLTNWLAAHRGGMDSKHGIQRRWRPMEEFVACFAGVVDPRQDNIRHNLHEVLMIALCTMLCGGEDCSDMALFGEAKEPFLRQFLRLRHGIPSQAVHAATPPLTPAMPSGVR